MATDSNQAPRRPGVSATWAPAGKTGVGTALSDRSPVWFTLSQGIRDGSVLSLCGYRLHARFGPACRQRQGFLFGRKTLIRSPR